MAESAQKKESLEEEVDHVVEEARMVLPGIQALLGFQLVAVFNQRFAELLPFSARVLHLASIVLVATAIALIMAPAAYHRQAERGTISRHLANLGSGLITTAMAPLTAAIALEVALVAYAILSTVWISVVLGLVLGLFFTTLWFIYPAVRRSRIRSNRAMR
jgi:membrane protein YdbS with pleckstrin-like domain